MIDVKKIKGTEEKMIFLGTDVLTEDDLELMSDEVGTSFLREEGAIYYLNEDYLISFKNDGYSEQFYAIAMEMFIRGYSWIFYDRDIETEMDL